jgi:5-methylcytosine-specific restriction endonuclease McrA
MDTARNLSARLLGLLRCEQSAQADFLVALSDFDRRRLWRELGYSSLFHYLHRELGMSKGAAHYRKTAAELIQKVPAVVAPMRAGELCITSIIELAKVLTPENQAEVLPRFLRCSRQEAKVVAAELCPAEAVVTRTVVTAMAVFPSRPPATAPVPVVVAPVQAVQPVELDACVGPAQPSRAEPLALAPPATAQRSSAEPLTADLRRLHMTVSKRFMEKLEAARDALSHSHPGADVEAILEAGLDLVIERAATRKGLVKRPRTQSEAPTLRIPSAEAAEPADVDEPRSRYVPAAVRRQVWLRDGGRCQFRLENGELCGSTHRLQFDHVRPVALGGASTVENVRVLCSLCRSRHKEHYADSGIMPHGVAEPARAREDLARDAA